MSYVGPTDDRINMLVAQFDQTKNPKKLAPVSQAVIALGCVPVVLKHFRKIKRLGTYGFYQAGGALIGTHALVAMGNMLGFAIRRPVTPWTSISRMPETTFR
jgi:hypothetical protein